MEEMDERVWEAFFRSILESVKDADLPMEPSDYLKNHLSEYSAHEGYKLNLKMSSFKKIGNLLETANKDGIIKY